jgi:hypothetical protein
LRLKLYLFADRIALHAQRNGRGVSQPFVVARPISIERLLGFMVDGTIDWERLRWKFGDDAGLLTAIGLGSSGAKVFSACDHLSFDWSSDGCQKNEICAWKRERGGWAAATGKNRVSVLPDLSDFGDVFAGLLREMEGSKHGESWAWKPFVAGDVEDGRLLFDPRVKSKRKSSKRSSVGESSDVDAEVFALEVEGFGFKASWAAVRCDDLNRVVAALSDDAFSVGVASGVRVIYGDLPKVRVAGGDRAGEMLKVAVEFDETDGVLAFALGPVSGWVLVMLGWMFGELVDVPTFMEVMSEDFGEAQYFVNHRGSSAFTWERWRKGVAVRRFCSEDGETKLDVGALTKAEKPLKIGEKSDVQVGTRMISVFSTAGESDVLAVAAGWSIDPSELVDRGDVPALGRLFVIRPE